MTRRLAPGAWCWFADPRAIHHAGAHRRTFVGWIDREGSIQVFSHDHDSRQEVVTRLHRRLQVDDHDNPALIVRPDGHLLAFYSKHSGSAMYYRRSVKPEDVSAWGPERRLPDNTNGERGFTYPNPVQLAAEEDRLYLFWRGANWNPAYATRDSGDGAGWSNARTMIRVPDERPYVKVVSDGDATIHFAFTDGHPRNVLTGIYHAVYRDGQFRRSDGSPIRAIGSGPITPAQATRVYDPNPSGVRAWIHDIALDAAGVPLMVFAVLHSPADHRYVYARWSGTGWVRHPIVNAGGTIAGDGAEVHYSGGITFDHDDPRRVLLSREIGGVHEVERWETNDGGASWQHAAVTSGSSRPNVRPIAARGRTDDAFDVLWMRGRYTNYRDYGTSIMTTDA